MNNYLIDGHKLHLHPARLAKWLAGEAVYPLYLELSPSGACNHRCVFCGMDFVGYKNRFMNTEIICKRLGECGELGVKAIMFGGEGEPLLHKDIAIIAGAAKNAGIDLSFTTNAVFLREELARKLLPITSWIKVSFNGGSAKTYANIHRTSEKDFARVLQNMALAAKIRQEEGFSCTLGFQCLLLPENAAEMPSLAARLRDLGADYLVIKPYSHNPKSPNDAYGKICYADTGDLVQKLKEEERDNFSVIYRNQTMQRWDEKNTAFDRCLALSFWGYIDAGSILWGCSRHMGENKLFWGNLMEESFKDIWMGEERLKKLNWCESCMDIEECHRTCRMEAVNEYLWRLKHPQGHDNFI